MRKAGELAGLAFVAAMKASYGGVGEAELESVFEHTIKTNGAQWLSFPPVVAGGNRANCLHYITNNKTIRYVTIRCHQRVSCMEVGMLGMVS